MAVGFWDTGTALRTLTERWNETQWSIVSSPSNVDVVGELWAVDAAPKELWSVGQTFGPISFRTLVQRFSC